MVGFELYFKIIENYNFIINQFLFYILIKANLFQNLTYSNK